MKSLGFQVSNLLLPNQDSKYALPTAPATVPQEVDASMAVRRQVAQSVQVSKMTEH